MASMQPKYLRNILYRNGFLYPHFLDIRSQQQTDSSELRNQILRTFFERRIPVATGIDLDIDDFTLCVPQSQASQAIQSLAALDLFVRVPDSIVWRKAQNLHFRFGSLLVRDLDESSSLISACEDDSSTVQLRLYIETLEHLFSAIKDQSNSVIHEGAIKFISIDATKAEILSLNQSLVVEALVHFGIKPHFRSSRHECRTRLEIEIKYMPDLRELLTFFCQVGGVYFCTTEKNKKTSRPTLATKASIARLSLSSLRDIRIWRYYIDPQSGSVLGQDLACDLRIQRLLTDLDGILEGIPNAIYHDNTIKFPMLDRRPSDAVAENVKIVYDVLQREGLRVSTVRKEKSTRGTLAILAEDAENALIALGHLSNTGAYLCATDCNRNRKKKVLINSETLLQFDPQNLCSIRIWKYYLHSDSQLVYGQNYGCDLEIWRPSTQYPKLISAPEGNSVGLDFSKSELEYITDSNTGRETFKAFARTSIHEVDPSIDAVYLWVDSSDPTWQSERNRYKPLCDADQLRTAAPERYRSRDELRYSLRSLNMYAPWIKNIYIVTSGQKPSFLDESAENLTFISHHKIADSDHLPSFNSSAITTWLHRIPGLADRFIFLNDDFFLGKDVFPADFFTPGGLPFLHFSNNQRPVASPELLSDLFLKMKANQRILLEKHFGRSISRYVMHVPHALCRDTLEMIEQEFFAEIEETRRSRFRSEKDINLDQFHHYYCEVTGRGVATSTPYCYVNLGCSSHRSRLEKLLDSRDLKFFCLNDVNIPGDTGISDEYVSSFLNRYFPIPSIWEKS